MFYFLPIAIVLIIIAGLRPIGMDKDSLNYSAILSVDISNANFLDKEPAFWIINQINKFVFTGNKQTFFLIFAVLGVSLKLIAIRKYSLFPMLSILTYVSMYFVLHEMTQIRVGVASAIFLLAIKDIKDKKFGCYILKTLLAMMFHYSAIIMLVFYFIDTKRSNIRILFFLPIAGLLLATDRTLGLSAFSRMASLLPRFLGSKIELYISLLYEGEHSDINIFNSLNLSLLIIYYFCLLNHRKMKSEYDIIFIKILGIMLFVFFSCSFLPVLAFRISEFLGVVLIFLIPDMLSAIKEKDIATVGIVIWLVVYFVFIMLRDTLGILNNI